MRALPSLVCALVAPLAAAAEPPPAASLRDAVRDGVVLLDVRARHEHVDDDAFAREADALTLRTRLGFRTAPFHGFTAQVAGEDVQALVDDYDSTANGRAGVPVVADPEGSEIDEAWLGWSRPGTQVALGRQRVALDNQRFFGTSGFRQNEQTFDALALTRVVGPVTVRALQLDSVQRVFGNEHPSPLAREQDLDAQLVNVAWAAPWGALAGYAYFVENEDLPLASTRTVGARWSGARAFGEGRLAATLELARQDDWRDGDPRIGATYRLAEATWTHGRHAVRVGHETLGGDGRTAFQTPFATLHAFNGWADRFLATPATGLRDLYAEYGVKLGPGQFVVRHHRFDADTGGADYGREWDTAYTWPIGTRVTVQAKLARYDADAFARDVTKAWLAVEYRR